MFKNQKLQAAYEEWQATAAVASASEVTLVYSEIPAAFIAEELQAFGLHLTPRDVWIVEQNFYPALLNECRRYPEDGLKWLPMHEFYVVRSINGSIVLSPDYIPDDELFDPDEVSPYTVAEGKAVSDKLNVSRQTARHILRLFKRIYDEKAEKAEEQESESLSARALSERR